MYSGVPAHTCECCGDKGNFRGCTLLPGRIICDRCLHVWYEGYSVRPDEIGKISREWRDDSEHWYNKMKRRFAHLE